jgi:hypothetical protein
MSFIQLIRLQLFENNTKGTVMAKTYKEFVQECNEDVEIMQDLLDDLPYTNEELEGLMEGKKFGIALKVIAVSLSSRLASASKRVLSAKDTNEKLDHLARAVSIAGGISAVSVALSGGTKGGLSKIIGLSALKN